MDQTPKSIKNSNRPGKEQILPTRFAHDTITSGDPFERSRNNYAKKPAPVDNQSMMAGFLDMMKRSIG